MVRVYLLAIIPMNKLQKLKLYFYRNFHWIHWNCSLYSTIIIQYHFDLIWFDGTVSRWIIYKYIDVHFHSSGNWINVDAITCAHCKSFNYRCWTTISILRLIKITTYHNQLILTESCQSQSLVRQAKVFRINRVSMWIFSIFNSIEWRTKMHHSSWFAVELPFSLALSFSPWMQFIPNLYERFRIQTHTGLFQPKSKN